MIVARYKQDKHLTIDLFLGDVFDVSADALIFGRTRAIKDRIETSAPPLTAATPHTPLQSPLFPHRQLLRTESRQLPWRIAYSIQYRPRIADPTSLHVQYLAFNLFQANQLYLRNEGSIDHVAIVPFSWRNPETLAFAILGGLLHVYPQLVTTPTHYTIAALDNLDAFVTLLEDPVRLKTAISNWIFFPPPPSRVARPFKRLAVDHVI